MIHESLLLAYTANTDPALALSTTSIGGYTVQHG